MAVFLPFHIYKNEEIPTNMKKKKGNLVNIILVLILLVGLSLLLYPTVSDYWNSFHQTRAITTYTEYVDTMKQETYDRIWAEATAYNQDLSNRSNQFALDEERQAIYEQTLDISGTGIMGYINIPKLDTTLPIYHGTDAGVLQVAVGHVEWSNLPIGGISTHCVLSGHRGLPSAKLFTNLDQMEIGDIFTLTTLDQTFTYEVDQILIVLPQEMSDLQVIEGQDLCTLVTCTPYSINTHRLLVRGHRIENLEEVPTLRVGADAMQIEPLIVAPVVALPILLILFVGLMVSGRKKKSRGGKKNEEKM